MAGDHHARDVGEAASCRGTSPPPVPAAPAVTCWPGWDAAALCEAVLVSALDRWHPPLRLFHLGRAWRLRQDRHRGEPVEELIGEAVLYRLDSPAVAATLAGSDADSDAQAATARAELEADLAQLEELATAYGT